MTDRVAPRRGEIVVPPPTSAFPHPAFPGQPLAPSGGPPLGPQASLQRLADALDYLVDPQVGIVRTVYPVPREAGAPNFFHYRAEASNTGAFGKQANFASTGGAAVDRGAAIAKALGEAVERYCAAIYDVDDLPLYAFQDAPFPCAAPDTFALFSQIQYERRGFPLVPFREDTPVRWTPAWDPINDKKLYVPAAMVYVPYYYHPGAGDSPIAQPISTGLACHCSFAEAALNAICEAVERDSFVITWLARLGMPRIPHSTLDPFLRDLVSRFERAGYTITLLNLTSDLGVPTVLAVSTIAKPGAPALTVAAAAAADPRVAARKALEELEHTRSYCQTITLEIPRLPYLACQRVVDQRSHLNFWCDPAHTPLADFLFASDSRVGLHEIPSLATGRPEGDLQALIQAILGAGYHTLLCDLTTSDVGQLGLNVVRAVIPGLQPLTVGYHMQALGGSRLWNCPQKLGLPGLPPGSPGNPYPHPYP